MGGVCVSRQVGHGGQARLAAICLRQFTQLATAASLVVCIVGLVMLLMAMLMTVVPVVMVVAMMIVVVVRAIDTSVVDWLSLSLDL